MSSQYGSKGYEVGDLSECPGFIATVEERLGELDDVTYSLARQLDVGDMSATQVGIALGYLARADDADVRVEKWGSQRGSVTWRIDPDGGEQE
jgi:hypothetical protein